MAQVFTSLQIGTYEFQLLFERDILMTITLDDFP